MRHEFRASFLHSYTSLLRQAEENAVANMANQYPDENITPNNCFYFHSDKIKTSCASHDGKHYTAILSTTTISMNVIHNAAGAFLTGYVY